MSVFSQCCRSLSAHFLQARVTTSLRRIASSSAGELQSSASPSLARTRYLSPSRRDLLELLLTFEVFRGNMWEARHASCALPGAAVHPRSCRTSQHCHLDLVTLVELLLLLSTAQQFGALRKRIAQECFSKRGTTWKQRGSTQPLPTGRAWTPWS